MLSSIINNPVFIWLFFTTLGLAFYITRSRTRHHTEHVIPVKRLTVLLLLGLTSLSISSCDSSGGSGPPPEPPPDPQCNTLNNGGWVTVETPTSCPAVTENQLGYVSGSAFISSTWSHCCSGSATDTGVTVTWRNESTGASGYAVQFVRYCWFFGSFPCDHTYIANVPLQMGENRVIIYASDPSNVSGQTTITFSRVPENVPPTVTSTSPVDQSNNVAPNQQLTASFSEEMDISSINNTTFTLTVVGGSTVSGTVSYNAQTASFVPDVQLNYSTQYEARITTGVRDLSNNYLQTPYVWQFTTAAAPDTTPPSVSSTDPTDTETCVALDTKISATFDEAIDTSTINTTSFTVKDLSNNPVSGYITTTNNSAKFNPNMALAYSTDYQATLTTDISDLSGNGLATNYSWTFSTVPDGIGSWSTMSTSNAPSGRSGHTAIWSGSEMIIWGGGGSNGNENTGGRYNPASDSWQATSITNAPSARSQHTAVWTGSEMIVWGGYDPATTWLNTGARYNPTTNSWTATTTTNAPSARRSHAAVWTGTEMIIWGGSNGSGILLDGARYNPTNDSWSSLSTTNAPTTNYVAYAPVAFWSGTEMLLFDRISVKGYRYNPTSDSWSAMSTTNAPYLTLQAGTVTWNGSEMLIWGYSYFGAYNPVTDTWRTLPTLCTPEARTRASAVWSGNKLIVWGGNSGLNDLNTGGYYDATTDTWSQTTLVNAPAPTSYHTAVWAGDRMIIWGGGTNAGGMFTPAP